MKRTVAQIERNLQDAGCTEDVIQAFLAYVDQGKTSDGMKLLERHRRSLLEELHQWQKKIDYLDYLIYHMEE